MDQFPRIGQWILSGEELKSHAQLDILYTGLVANKNYLANLAFGKFYSEKYLGRKPIWEIFRSRSNYMDCSLIVTESYKIFQHSFQKNGYSYLPGWVIGKYSIPDDFDNLINNHSVQTDIKRIKRNGIEFEVTHDIAKFRQFYHDMYVPLAKMRHGGAAFVNKYLMIKLWFKEGALLLIKQDGKYIAGSIIFRHDFEGSLCVLGVIDGNVDYIRDGAIGAIYYYAMSYLHLDGCRVIDAGLSRPFLNDGVLRYKRKWGLTITGGSPFGFYLKATDDSAGVMGFLMGNPFVTMEGKVLKAVIVVEPSQHDRITAKKAEKNYWYRGLVHFDYMRVAEDGTLHPVCTA